MSVRSLLPVDARELESLIPHPKEVVCMAVEKERHNQRQEGISSTDILPQYSLWSREG